MKLRITAPPIGNKVYNNTVYRNKSWGIMLQNEGGMVRYGPAVLSAETEVLSGI